MDFHCVRRHALQTDAADRMIVLQISQSPSPTVRRARFSSTNAAMLAGGTSWLSNG
jgi:hypothetical protein